MFEFWASKEQNDEDLFHLQHGTVKIKIVIKAIGQNKHQLIFIFFNCNNIRDIDSVIKSLHESYKNTAKVPIDFQELNASLCCVISSNSVEHTITDNVAAGKSEGNSSFYLHFIGVEDNLLLFLDDFLKNCNLYYARDSSSKMLVTDKKAPTNNDSPCNCTIF